MNTQHYKYKEPYFTEEGAEEFPSTIVTKTFKTQIKIKLINHCKILSGGDRTRKTKFIILKKMRLEMIFTCHSQLKLRIKQNISKLNNYSVVQS